MHEETKTKLHTSATGGFNSTSLSTKNFNMTSKSTVARESVYSQKSSTGGIGGHARAGYSQSPFGRKDSTSFCAMVEEEEEEEKASEIASKKSALAKKQAEKKNRVSSVTNRKPEKSL